METITKSYIDDIMIMVKRTKDTYKNKCGIIGAVAGSVGMAGAAVLCGLAALRAGCGLMQYYVPDGIRDVLQMAVPEATCRSRKPDESILDCDSLAVGPGLGFHKEDREILTYLLGTYTGTMVFDADGINNITRMELQPLVKDFSGNLIMTPHRGEAARLLGIPFIPAGEQAAAKAARHLAETYHATVVLKGHETIVCDPEGNLVCNRETGNPGMATGGSGDVLTGLIASLVGQGLPYIDAAIAGVYIHGMAGDLAAEKFGENGMVAGDIARALADAIKSIIGR